VGYLPTKWYEGPNRRRGLAPLPGERVFRGHFRHTIDPKGRVSIPAKFRDVLADDFGDRLVIAPNDDALEVHPLKSWEEMEARVMAISRFDQDARELRHAYLSLGLDVAIDPQGRIQISPDYREQSGLVKDVLVVGMIDYFEIWDAERWAHHRRDNGRPLRDLFDRVAKKGA
jgi:MraZ protein